MLNNTNSKSLVTVNGYGCNTAVFNLEADE